MIVIEYDTKLRGRLTAVYDTVESANIDIRNILRRFENVTVNGTPVTLPA